MTTSWTDGPVAVDVAEIASAVAVAVAAPSAADIAQEVNAYGNAAQAISDSSYALTTAATTGATVALSTNLGVALSWYGGDFQGTDLEVLLASVGAGFHIEVWGLIVTGGSTPTYVHLRSGNKINDGTSTPVRNMLDQYDITIPRGINSGGGFVVPPGARALWRTVNSKGLIIKKVDAAAQMRVEVWFRTVAD
jgi:hypothetical protein